MQIQRKSNARAQVWKPAAALSEMNLLILFSYNSSYTHLRYYNQKG
jgi:hypothetical protein